ncbi:MAG: hypothetical protein WC508_04950 [Patescibacteria group bacterium]
MSKDTDGLTEPLIELRSAEELATAGQIIVYQNESLNFQCYEIWDCFTKFGWNDFRQLKPGDIVWYNTEIKSGISGFIAQRVVKVENQGDDLIVTVSFHKDPNIFDRCYLSKKYSFACTEFKLTDMEKLLNLIQIYPRANYRRGWAFEEPEK